MENVIITLKNEHWIRFDIYWLQRKEELERAVWNCKGIFGGNVPPSPPDIISQKLHSKIIEWQIDRERTLMKSSEHYINNRWTPKA